ncbi:hypothetical protein [Magnetospirillum sp. SS-4]|uniref:hypothetical protein n=1 Tax=Magnetospirillum sp. SS-4 TaxID=2681465 RepID=UPI001380EBD6|nr:hypothetical protein [Magnetospirillum sp. SS-4]CAA7618516.1 hypothetical protein MTBSS4_210119 [Magnetospirillum sp. SS-4]
MKTRPLSYGVVQLRDISGPRTVARLWCAQCGETLDLAPMAPVSNSQACQPDSVRGALRS